MGQRIVHQIGVYHASRFRLLFLHRYDPTADLPTDLDTEQDRVIFIKSTAQFLVGAQASVYN